MVYIVCILTIVLRRNCGMKEILILKLLLEPGITKLEIFHVWNSNVLQSSKVRLQALLLLSSLMVIDCDHCDCHTESLWIFDNRYRSIRSIPRRTKRKREALFLPVKMANLRQTPLTCSGHTRPVVHLAFSDVTECGYFLISACKGELCFKVVAFLNLRSLPWPH
jgi:hypothetical protein